MKKYLLLIPFFALLLAGCTNSSPTIKGIDTSEEVDTSEPSKPLKFIRDDDYSTERSYEEYGDYDCSDFGSWEEAQGFFEDEGGPDEDYHNLDRDGDGIACEALQ